MWFYHMIRFCLIFIFLVVWKTGYAKICVYKAKTSVNTRSACQYFPTISVCKDESHGIINGWKKERRCCKGWTTVSAKSPCSTPMCYGKASGGCHNGGKCVAPNVCRCRRGFESPRCGRASDEALQSLCKMAYQENFTVKGISRRNVRRLCKVLYRGKFEQPVDALELERDLEDIANLTPETTTLASRATTERSARRAESAETTVITVQANDSSSFKVARSHLQHLCQKLDMDTREFQTRDENGQLSIGFIMGLVGIVGMFVTLCSCCVCVVAYCNKSKIPKDAIQRSWAKPQKKDKGKAFSSYIKRIFKRKEDEKKKNFQPVRRKVRRRRSSVF